MHSAFNTGVQRDHFGGGSFGGGQHLRAGGPLGRALRDWWRLRRFPGAAAEPSAPALAAVQATLAMPEGSVVSLAKVKFGDSMQRSYHFLVDALLFISFLLADYLILW